MLSRRGVLTSRHFEDSPDDYIAAEIAKGSVSDMFVVGDSNVYGSYLNAPLQTDGAYEIRVGAVSKGNESVRSPWKPKLLITNVQPIFSLSLHHFPSDAYFWTDSTEHGQFSKFSTIS